MKHLLITGGGTGGHLVIAKTLLQEAVSQNITAHYMGATYGQDMSWFEHEEAFTTRNFFTVRGVVNQSKLGKLSSMWRILKATLKARRIIKQEHIDAVISVGGYAAAPASFAAILTRTPLFIHEQNASMGRLNSLLARFSRRVFSAYTTPATHYPVRQELFETAHIRKKCETILFLGGSQGATAINDIALLLAPWLEKHHITILHQCGNAHINDVQMAYKKMGIVAQVFGFTRTMPKLINQADLAIARAGASSVWETTANHLPTIFIPYPHAANDHQTANAQAHVDKNAAWIFAQNSIDIEAIKAIITSDISTQSSNLKALIQPNGAQYIIDTIKEKTNA